MPTIVERVEDIIAMLRGACDLELAVEEALSALEQLRAASAEREMLVQRWLEVCARNCAHSEEIAYYLEEHGD